MAEWPTYKPDPSFDCTASVSETPFILQDQIKRHKQMSEPAKRKLCNFPVGIWRAPGYHGSKVLDRYYRLVCPKCHAMLGKTAETDRQVEAISAHKEPTPKPSLAKDPLMSNHPPDEIVLWNWEKHFVRLRNGTTRTMTAAEAVNPRITDTKTGEKFESVIFYDMQNHYLVRYRLEDKEPQEPLFYRSGPQPTKIREHRELRIETDKESTDA